MVTVQSKQHIITLWHDVGLECLGENWNNSKACEVEDNMSMGTTIRLITKAADDTDFCSVMRRVVKVQ